MTAETADEQAKSPLKSTFARPAARQLDRTTRLQSDEVSRLPSFDGSGDEDDFSSKGSEVDDLKAEVARLQRELSRLRRNPHERERPSSFNSNSQGRRSRSLSPATAPRHKLDSSPPMEMKTIRNGLHHRRHAKDGDYVNLPQGDVNDEEDGILLTTEVDVENPDGPSVKVLDDCEQDTSFRSSVLDRSGWLVGLLVMQSLSSFIIKRNEHVLAKHAVIVQFLTMLVGAGGNAGNQATVKVIRGLAIGRIRSDNTRNFLSEELKIGLSISIILALAGFVRVLVFQTPAAETLAITISLFAIVCISTIVGSLLPLVMKWSGIDPAHSSTSIQVIMDIVGVTITVHVCSAILDGRD